MKTAADGKALNGSRCPLSRGHAGRWEETPDKSGSATEGLLPGGPEGFAI